MDEISNSISCDTCKNVLESPVLLPCGDSICKKHTINCKGPILCCICEIEHRIPTNGGFPQNKGLAKIILAQTNHLQNERKEARESCQRFDELLENIEQILNDPFNFSYEAIEFLKRTVQLKGEEMILKVNKKMREIISKLDECKIDCKTSFSKNEFVVKSKKLSEEKKIARTELKKWLSTLNEIKINTKEWERIQSKSQRAIVSFQDKLVEFKFDLLPKNFGELKDEIVKEFGKFEIDPSIYLGSLIDSVIITDMTLRIKLFQLCEFESSQKLELLYRGSLHGFKASDFHSKCDDIPKTLTIIKVATSGNIFGGYTEACWDQCNSYDSDKNAFIFSLVNSENKPVKVKISNEDGEDAIYCSADYGPIFGGGNDIFIENDSNISDFNRSDFGFTYKLKNYKRGSEAAQSFLAGSYYFTVEEIEVFRLK